MLLGCSRVRRWRSAGESLRGSGAQGAAVLLASRTGSDARAPPSAADRSPRAALRVQFLGEPCHGRAADQSPETRVDRDLRLEARDDDPEFRDGLAPFLIGLRMRFALFLQFVVHLFESHDDELPETALTNTVSIPDAVVTLVTIKD